MVVNCRITGCQYVTVIYQVCVLQHDLTSRYQTDVFIPNSAGKKPSHHRLTHTGTQTLSPVQTSRQRAVITLPISKKTDTTLTEPNYWIFIGCLRPRRDCSILAWGGHTIKGDESRKCLLLIAQRSHYRPAAAAGRYWWRVDTCPNTHTHTQTDRHVFTNAYTHTALKIHISPPPAESRCNLHELKGGDR